MIIKKREKERPPNFNTVIDIIQIKQQEHIKKFHEHTKRTTLAALFKLISLYKLGNTFWSYSGKRL